MIRWIALLLVLCGIATAFECPSDIILRLVLNNQTTDLEGECLRETTSNECTAEVQTKADNVWKEFEELYKRYHAAVAECLVVRKADITKRDAFSRRRGNPTRIKIDDTGYKQRRVRHLDDRLPYSEPERIVQSTRARRHICMNKGKKGLNHLNSPFKEQCDPYYICLPDLNLPSHKKRERINEIKNLCAKKYAEYLELQSLCNANADTA